MMNYHTTIFVDASPDEVMKKISQVNRWWAKSFSGRAERMNDKFNVTFGETFVDFQVNELVPNKKVSWEVSDCNLHWVREKKEWQGTRIVFELSVEKGMTRLDFTHFGLVPEAECYKDCEVGWNGHITVSLANYINEGKGEPE